MGSQAVTFLLVSIPWLFFRAQSLADAGILLGRLATGWDSLGILLQGVWPLIPALLCLPLVEPLGEPETRPRSFVCGALVVFTLTISVCLARLSQAAGGSPNAFLYFQF